MGRSKSYNEQEVLTALANEFSQHGYNATSIDQIAKATGMKRGSIYQAFDSKANLFRLSFRHALESTAEPGVLADLVFVALWERAGLDPDVRTTAQSAIEKLELLYVSPISEIVTRRLFERAGLN